jgi:hypothetical protein
LLPFPAAVELDRIVTGSSPVDSLIHRHAAGALLFA